VRRGPRCRRTRRPELRVKVGVLTTSYPRSPDDPAGHFVRGFCEWLAAHVGEVEVLACGDEDMQAQLRSGGLPERLRQPSGAALAVSLSARLVAMALRRQAGWDAIVSHWLLPCGAVGLMLQRGRPHLALAHGSDITLARALPLGSHLVRALARRADLVYVAESLRLEGAPGRVVPMPALDPPRPRSDEERAAARASLALPPVGEGPLVALFLGRLVLDKGVDLLLDVLPKDVLLLVAGDGPLRGQLERHPSVTAGRARLVGPRFGKDKRALLCAADLLVVPSRRDGSPTVLAEARAADLPILATRVGGISAALGASGWLVDPTGTAICAELSTLAHDRKRLSQPVLPPETWAEIGPRLWRGARTAMSSSYRNITIINC